jgi:hypothetical protein
MLEVDDSGWGCPIGGVLVGIYRRESEEFVSGVVPVRCFQPPAFGEREYLERVRRLARHLMAQLRVHPRELIRVCRGPLFQELRGELYKRRLNFQPADIEQTAQELVEKAFALQLNRLGIHPELLERFGHDHPGARFHALLAWVAEDFPGRLRYCKTGWASWPKWEKEIRQVCTRNAQKEVGTDLNLSP